jgi:NAD(P)-dependent dehydrogenase (short-subunit alcohol dehydrogenase family)
MNKTALVTGAGQRIGQALAITLAEAGYNIAIHYYSSRDGAEETARQVRELGRRAEIFRADLREPSAPKRLAEEVLGVFDDLEVLINNASLFPQPGRMQAESDLLRQNLEEWEELLSVNSRAPFFLIQALAPTLSQSGQGLIVNILDTSVSEPFLSRAAHTVSKSCLAAINRLAAKSLYPRVRVNALELGAILPPSELSEIEKKTLNWAGVKAVQQALMFLLESSFVNGEILKLDQGATALGKKTLG